MSLVDQLQQSIGTGGQAANCQTPWINQLTPWQAYAQFWTAGALTDDEQLVLIAMRKNMACRDAIVSAALQAMVNARIFPPEIGKAEGIK